MYTNSVYSICFSIDGSQLLATAGHDVLVYRSIDGHLLNTLKGKMTYINYRYYIMPYTTLINLLIYTLYDI